MTFIELLQALERDRLSPVINSFHQTHDLKWTDIDPPEIIKELTVELEPLLRKFYGRTT